MAAIVLTLIEWLRSPPVPTMSTARDRSSSPSGTIDAASSTASSRPLSYRRHLGRAVAFEQAQSELFLERTGD